MSFFNRSLSRTLNLVSQSWCGKSLLGKLIIVVLSVSIAMSIPARYITDILNDSAYVRVYAVNEKNPASEGYEVWIQSILLDDQPIDFSSVQLSEGWYLNDAGTSIYGVANADAETQPLMIGPYRNVSNIRFVLGTHQWSGLARFEAPSQIHLTDLYTESAEITSRYFITPPVSVAWDRFTTPDYIFIALRYLLIWVAAFALLLVFSQMRSGSIIFSYAIVSLFLWLGNEYIKPAGSVLLFLGMLSTLSLTRVFSQWENPEFRAYHEKTGYVLGIWGVCLYASFASFGYRLFLSGEYMHFSLTRLACLLWGTLWFLPVVMAILSVLESISLTVLSRNNISRKLSRRGFFFTTFVATLLSFSISYVGFFPGGFPSDCVDQLTQAMTNAYNNWHPAVHTFLMKICLVLFHHPTSYIILQLIVMAALIARIALVAYDCNASARCTIIVAVLFALLPNQAVSNISPLKDYAFSYCMLWATILLFTLALDITKIKKTGFWLQLTVCMFLIKEIRHNGIVPLAFMFILLTILSIKYWHRIRHFALCSIAASIALIIFMDGPFFSLLHVQPNPVSPFVTMFCGVGSCLNKDKQFSEETNERLLEIMPLEKWKQYYGRFVGHDNYLWGSGEYTQMDLSSFGAAESFKIYFEALVNYPDIVIKDRMDGMNIMWDVSQPDDPDSFNCRVYDYIYTSSALGLTQPGFPDGVSIFIHNPIADAFRDLVIFSFPGERTEDQLTDMLLWRSGAYLIMFLILVIYWTKNKLFRMWWPAVPLLGNTAGLLLVLYHQSFRYIYYIQLIVIAMTIMTFRLQKSQHENSQFEHID